MSKTYQPKRLRSRRRLPHWQAPDGVYATVFRLKGSLPRNVITRLQQERAVVKNKLLKKGLPETIIQQELSKMRRFYFGQFDSLLDNSSTGPHFLKEPLVAKLVEDAILFFDNKKYKVIDYCIMSNHVHLTIYKLTKEIGNILGSIKKYTSREINILHHCEGRQVWLNESYDHLIRDREDLTFYHTYTLENPVKAKLVQKWSDYPFTYARPGFEDFYRPQLL